MRNPSTGKYYIGYARHDVVCDGVVVHGKKVVADRQPAVSRSPQVTAQLNPGPQGRQSKAQQAAILALMADLELMRIALDAAISVLEAHGLCTAA